LYVLATVVSVNDRHAVADCGLKALGMDHGPPALDDGAVWIVSDEHLTFRAPRRPAVGDVVRVWPAHVDPTVAYHERMYLATGPATDADLLETWAVDLRGW
jgi:D-serine deaminase-like pyridoxal phosphate-dependent protein